MRFLANCLWLTLPPLLFNVAFGASLPPAFGPAVFWHDIPWWISVPENVLRVVVFAAPVLMPLSLDTRARRVGLGIYGAGLLVYFASWAALILAPESAWSTSAVGFLAPAYTPLVWLLGIARVGDRLFLPVRYRWWMYLVVCVAFLAFHDAHAALVFSRLG